MDNSRFYLFVMMMFMTMKLFKDVLVILEINRSYHFIILPILAVILYGAHFISPDIKKSKMFANFRLIIVTLLVFYGVLFESEKDKSSQILYKIFTIVVLMIMSTLGEKLSEIKEREQEIQ